ncbi:hypothetical protein PCC6912_40250 [Chlorogloeopsis fritschii PCC 6912]|uniref:Uncharacterized protein n=1 Tax=Chlorogloeopsis fritschii PCC 6912 TaxID=211165 RepID=A0A3S0Y5L5_CHLFR|nr:hypothetical protein [Chlorogloeopsis fritschii]RUR77066.1 hypothetical protein PCC6912_40250 [Chlorogloeopsis fritschii PCC 6912]
MIYTIFQEGDRAWIRAGEISEFFDNVEVTVLGIVTLEGVEGETLTYIKVKLPQSLTTSKPIAGVIKGEMLVHKSTLTLAPPCISAVACKKSKKANIIKLLQFKQSKDNQAPSLDSFSSYIPSPEDQEAIAGNAELLSIPEINAEQVTELTEGWTQEFKQAVWKQLTPETKTRIKAMMKVKEVLT